MSDDGTTYVEDIGNEFEKVDAIRVARPRPSARVSSPLVLEGTAIGTWFFEGTMPVEIRDDTGKVQGKGFVSAQTDWMTETFVPFLGAVEFDFPESFSRVRTSIDLFFMKSNPSGLPEHDDFLRVPLITVPR